MTRLKPNAYLVSILVILFSLFVFQSSLAQDFPSLYEAFPQRGGLGEVVNLLLRGDGFELFENLDAVILNGAEMRILAFDVLSNELIEIQIMIPQNTPVGITEIRFIFDENAYDAYFEVTEGGEEDISPVITQIWPQEGGVDTEMSLFVELSYLFEIGVTRIPRYEWGEFVNMIIGGVEVTVNSIEVNDSGDVFEYRIYIPPETPISETEIHLYYENYSHRDFFLVTRQEGTPIIYGYGPVEGQGDTEVEFFLEGENLFGLGELVGVEIAGMNVPILYNHVESNQVAVVGVYLPPEIPFGETGIVFFFENYAYEDAFNLIGDSDPIIRRLTPQEGEVDTDIELYLEGENLFGLGELVWVGIADVDLTVWDFEIESNESMVVYAYLPEETPTGRHSITVAFENAEINETFFVSAPTPPPPPEFPIEIVVVIGVIVVVGAGILLARAWIRSTPQQEKPEESPSEPPSKFDIKVVKDIGIQTVDPDQSSLTLGFDLRVEIEDDSGEQTIETRGHPLINDD